MGLVSRLRAAVAEAYIRNRDHSNHVAIKRLLERTQYDPADMTRDRQWLQLQQILRHAYDSVPFYRKRFDELGCRPQDLRTWDDFAQLPPLSKQDVRTYAAELLSSTVRTSERTLKSTSGSTGVPIRIWHDHASIEWKAACTLRADEWSGWRFGEPVGKVWGNPEYQKHGWKGWLRNRFIDRAEYLDTLHVTDASLGDFARRLRRHRPTLIFGHAHSVYLFARYLEDSGDRVPTPRGIITSAMTLHDWQRVVIERMLGCRVTNRYGCEEVSIIACECEEHHGLHVSAESVYVEIEGGGRTGSLLVTDLTNRAMPLIRYRLGDTATLTDRRCACGRTLPLIDELHGREADYLTTPEGVRISGVSLTENFILEIPGVEQVQIVQHTRERFTLRVVRENGFEPAGPQRVEAVFRRLFGARAKYQMEYVNEIPRGPNGKVRFCISELSS